MKWKNIKKSQVTKTDPRINTKFEVYIIIEMEFVIKKNTLPQRKL